jgi:hypothetical protein
MVGVGRARVKGKGWGKATRPVKEMGMVMVMGLGMVMVMGLGMVMMVGQAQARPLE